MVHATGLIHYLGLANLVITLSATIGLVAFLLFPPDDDDNDDDKGTFLPTLEYLLLFEPISSWEAGN